MNLWKRLKVAALVLWGDDLVVAAARVDPPADALQRIADALAAATMRAIDDLARELRSSLRMLEQSQLEILSELRVQTAVLNELGGRVTTLEGAQRRAALDVTSLQLTCAALIARATRGEARLDVLDRVTGLSRPSAGA